MGKSKEFIVAKYILRSRGAKTTSYEFRYFVNGRKMSTADSGIRESMFNSKIETEKIKNMKLNSFYYAKFNPKYPDVIVVDLDKPITDTLVMLKGGFSMEEIKKIEEQE